MSTAAAAEAEAVHRNHNNHNKTARNAAQAATDFQSPARMNVVVTANEDIIAHSQYNDNIDKKKDNEDNEEKNGHETQSSQSKYHHWRISRMESNQEEKDDDDAAQEHQQEEEEDHDEEIEESAHIHDPIVVNPHSLPYPPQKHNSRRMNTKMKRRHRSRSRSRSKTPTRQLFEKKKQQMQNINSPGGFEGREREKQQTQRLRKVVGQRLRFSTPPPSAPAHSVVVAVATSPEQQPQQSSSSLLFGQVFPASSSSSAPTHKQTQHHHQQQHSTTNKTNNREKSKMMNISNHRKEKYLRSSLNNHDSYYHYDNVYQDDEEDDVDIDTDSNTDITTYPDESDEVSRRTRTSTSSMTDQPVHWIEYGLRWMCGLLGAYWLGMYHQQRLQQQHHLPSHDSNRSSIRHSDGDYNDYNDYNDDSSYSKDPWMIQQSPQPFEVRVFQLLLYCLVAWCTTLVILCTDFVVLWIRIWRKEKRRRRRSSRTELDRPLRRHRSGLRRHLLIHENNKNHRYGAFHHHPPPLHPIPPKRSRTSHASAATATADASSSIPDVDNHDLAEHVPLPGSSSDMEDEGSLITMVEEDEVHADEALSLPQPLLPQSPPRRQQQQQQQQWMTRNDTRIIQSEQQEHRAVAFTATPVAPVPTMPHPALEPFLIMDVGRQSRVVPNDVSQPYPITNEYFAGNMVALIRTPDCNNENHNHNHSSNGRSSRDRARSRSRSLEMDASFINPLPISSSTPSQQPLLPLQSPLLTQQQQTTFITTPMTASRIFASRSADSEDDRLPDRNRRAREYLSLKSRRFEFQFQFRLKKVPTGRMYFGIQLNDPVKLGVIQRAFVSAAMAFIRTTNPNFTYSLGGGATATGVTTTAAATNANNDGTGLADDNDDHSKPIMAFPVEEGMNRVVCTPAGQTPPQLGAEIHEDAEAMRKRRKGHLNWNLQDTYTMSLWSAYVDFIDWRCLNLPGIRPFQLEGVIGLQPMTVVLYEDVGNGRKTKIFQLELSNADKLVIGPSARKWKETHESANGKRALSPSLVEASNSPMDLETNAVNTMGECAVEETGRDDGCIGEEVVDVKEEERLAELGEGIYVESGDRIHLREILPAGNSDGPDDTDQSCFVTYSGGLCVLQEVSSGTIIIEKFKKARKSSKRTSKLIRSGDTVTFRLLTVGAEGEETRYLSTHRGRWMKWVSHVPTKNGLFTIHTHETECTSPVESEEECDDISVPEMRSLETQQSYLTWGSSFYLRHKRWSKYKVGVAAAGSATYGGRLMGLYSPLNTYDDDFRQLDEVDAHLDSAVMDRINGQSTKGKDWMRPLRLRAFEVSSAAVSLPNSIMTNSTSRGEGKDKDVKYKGLTLRFSDDAFRVDVPAWLELLNRKDRVVQLAYAVRVSRQINFKCEGTVGNESGSTDGFLCLRTGRQLSPIMRVGLEWRNGLSSSIPQRSDVSDLTAEGTAAHLLSLPNNYVTAQATPSNNSIQFEVDENPNPSNDDEEDSSFDNSASGEWFIESGEDDVDAARFDDEEIRIEGLADASGRPKSRLRGKKLIDKIASKSKTVVITGMKVGKDTGTTVVRNSVIVGNKVGKGTVNVSKSIIAPRSKQRHEPASIKRPIRMKKGKKGKEFGVAVTRSMKRLEKQSSWLPTEVPPVVAGELSAVEQSCRTVSCMLSTMSSLPSSDRQSDYFSNLLAAEVEKHMDLESLFLSGGAMQLGVIPNEKKRKILHDCVVARCIWESHWREELCAVFENTVTFIPPLTNAPSLELTVEDIQSLRTILPSRWNPFPGLFLLAIETSWMCHYVSFISDKKRSEFKSFLEEMMAEKSAKRNDDQIPHEPALWEARFWQGFASSIAYNEGKWAKIVSGIHLKSRLILNNRRMMFDLPEAPENPVDFVADLLSTSLSFSKLTHLKDNPKQLVAFLDATCQLRRLSLHDFDLASTSAFCFFVNLYHCLLQHGLLFAMKGPLHKRSFGHFMRTTCYEIGAEVFSLAELHACVIRGNLSRPFVSKPPAVEAAKKSASSYRFYALGYTNPRINFVLNTADVACPRGVIVFHPDHLLSQLNEQTAAFLRQNVTVDVSRRTVFLPKVCDVYRFDFVTPNDNATAAYVALTCLRYCLSFLDSKQACLIQAMLEVDELSLVIKYQPSSTDQYHTSLCLASS